MMFTLNDNEKKLQNELRKETEIPSVVRDKANEAYRKIEARKITQKAAPKDPLRWMKMSARVAGSAAAVLAAGFLVCVTNPVMARELPLVGGLFERLQNEVSFFGNFADNATVLEEPDAADGSETEKASSGTADSVYTKTSNGLTITFSEVYANSQAVYLTMMAKSETPFPDTLMQQTENGTSKPHFQLYMDPIYSFEADQTSSTSEGKEANVFPEGIFLDEYTYSCILRLDLADATTDRSEYNSQYNAMVQSVLDEMGITSEDLNDETEKGYALLEEFIAKVTERAGALQSYIKKIRLPESFNLHIDIYKFIGTKAEPEFWDSGYSQEELAAMSDEEWREIMAQEPAEYRESPNKFENYWYDGPWSYDIPIRIDDSQTVILDINETNEAGIGLKSVIKTPYELTVRELYEDGSNSDTFMVALDADGNKLPYNDSNNETNNFAIQDRDISTVDIYILDYMQYMDELKGPERYNNNENKPEEEKWSTLLDANAKYHKTIHFDS